MKQNSQPLRFHWRLPVGQEKANAGRLQSAARVESALPDLEAQVRFCRCAEEQGMDSVLTAFSFFMSDPIVLTTALGMATQKIKFMVAYRSGVMAPTLFVQQLNTLSALINGRLSLNIVAGHSPAEQQSYGDYLSHDERYARTEEFLAICRAFWRREGAVNFQGNHYQVTQGTLNIPFVAPDRTFPEIYISGSSPPAQELVLSQGSCWLMFPDTPQKLRDKIRPVLQQGIEVGLRLAIIARPTKTEAVEAAYELIGKEPSPAQAIQNEKNFVQKTDAHSFQTNLQLSEDEEWLTPWLWTGVVKTHGPATIAMVGTPEEIASAIIEYKKIGVSQFIFSGWPKLEEMIYFGQEVLPRVRDKEQAASTGKA